MKNKRFTRIMSLAMAMCMVFAIVPTASANTVGEDVVYKFLSTEVSSSNKIYVYGTSNDNYYDNLNTVKTDITERQLLWTIDSVDLSNEKDNANVIALQNTGLAMTITGRGYTGNAVLKITVEEAGCYDIKINIDETDLRRDTCEGYIRLYKTSEDDAVASYTLSDEKYDDITNTDTVHMGGAYLEKGEYYLKSYVKHNGAGTSYFYIKTLTLTPVNGDVFAEKFAVIEKNKNNTDNYDIHFFGGLKSIDYKAVGFEVTVGSVLQPDITTTNVYEQITVSVGGNPTVKTAANFGTGSKYIYYATLEDVSAGSEIVITPYVLDGDNNKIYYGKTFTYTVTTAA